MNKTKPKVHIFDNGGKTYDRYTAVIVKTGEIVGFNDNPFHSLGFGQYVGNVTDRMNITFGYGWEKQFPTKKDKSRILRAEIHEYLRQAEADKNWIGKHVEFSALSEQAQKYVEQVMKDE